MQSLRALLATRHANYINQGGVFSFSVTHSLDYIKEIEDMGEKFTNMYQYTVADIPGKLGCRIICISLKDQNRR